MLAGAGSTVVLLVALVALAEPRPAVHRATHRTTLEVALPRLTAGTTATVAVLSGLAVRAGGAGTAAAERAVAEVVARAPTGAVVAGGLVRGRSPDPAARAGEVARLLAPLPRAGVPTYVVLGAHDRAVGGVDELTAALDAVGVGVLRDEAVPLPGPGPDVAAVHLVGLDGLRPGRSGATRALTELPDGAARLVVTPDPASFRALPPGSAPVAVAGRARCERTALPDRAGSEAPPPTSPGRPVRSGWAPDGYGAPGNRLHVTCGPGPGAVPARDAAPRVVLVELRPAG